MLCYCLADRYVAGLLFTRRDAELLYLIKWQGEILLWLTRTTLCSQDLLPLKTTNCLQLLTIYGHKLRLGPSRHASVPCRYRL